MMNRTGHTTQAVLAAFLAAGAAQLPAQTGLDNVHADLGMAGEAVETAPGSGVYTWEWEPHYHVHGGPEYELGEAFVVVNASTQKAQGDFANPGGHAFLFAGGNPYVWHLNEDPQFDSFGNFTQNFLGFGAEEIGGAANPFATAMRYELHSVSGPGEFVVFDFGGSGPEAVMNSQDGIDGTQDFFFLNAGGHLHQNLAFTAPGDYEVTFSVSATLDDTWEGLSGGNWDNTAASTLATYEFQVVPEPAVYAALAGLLALGAALWRRMRVR